MHKVYSTYIENLKGRRYDEVLRESVLSESYHSKDYPDVAKYVLESMQEIDPSYSYKFYSAFRRTQDLITQELGKLGLEVDVRYQGPHNAETHIDLYGGLELLVIRKNYEGKASSTVEELAQNIVGILSNTEAYNMVDYADQHRIKIQTRKPTASVTIIPAVWVNSSLFEKTGLEINRGICEFNFSRKSRRVYLPFLNTARLNARNRTLGGSLKCLIRLIMSIIRDSDEHIDLVYEEVVGILYNMKIKEMAVKSSKYMSLLPNVSQHLEALVTRPEYRQKIPSPNRTEYVFGKRDKVQALQHLKKDLDEIISDLNEALKGENKSLLSSFPY